MLETSQCSSCSIAGENLGREVDINHAREVFAYLLSPLVRDKLVSKFEYYLAETRHQLDRNVDVIEAAIEEGHRHLI